MDDTVRRATALAGPAGIAVTLGTVAVAVLLSPWFSWTANALSDLGHPSRATAPLFNGGLVVAGLLGLAFATRLWPETTNAAHRLGLGLVALSFLALALVGVVPAGRPLHTPVAVVIFAALTYALFASATGDVLAGRDRRAIATTWLAVAHVTGWAVWPLSGLSGIAIPETVGSLVLAAWVLSWYRDLGPGR